MKYNKCFLILILLVVLYLFLALYLISSNTHFPTTDAPNHATFCIQFYGDTINLFSNTELSLVEKILEFKNIFSRGIVYWPKLLCLSSLPFLLILGPSVMAIKLANLIYLVLFMVFGYLLILKLGANDKEALLFVITLPFYPIVLMTIQSYGLDLPLMSMTVVFFFLLLKTEGFRNSFYSVLAGCSLGVGLLIKGQILIFTLLPILLYFISSALKGFKHDGNYTPLFRIFANFALFLICAFYIGGFWWKGKYDEILSAFNKHTISEYKHFESIPYENPGTLGYYSFYFKYLYLHGFGPLLSCFLLVPFFRYLFNKNLVNKLIVFSWLFLPFVLFSFLFKVQQLRFLLPLVPVIAMVAIIGTRFKRAFFTIVSRLFLLALLVFQIYLLMFLEEDTILYEKLFAVGSRDAIKKSHESNNLDIANKFYQGLENYLPPGAYKSIVVRLAPVEDGPLSIQFWLELEGYKRGYTMLTHDLLDQWSSIYEWWKEDPGQYVILFIENKSRDLGVDNFFDKECVLKIEDDLSIRMKMSGEDPEVIELLNHFFPILEKESKKLFDFNSDNYYCEVYEYENIPTAY